MEKGQTVFQVFEHIFSIDYYTNYFFFIGN